MSGANFSYDVSHDYTQTISPCDDLELREFGEVFLPTFYCLVFILGVIGNGLVVCVPIKYRHQATLTDVYLLNLALSDLLFVLTLPFFANLAVLGRWVFGDAVCRLLGGCQQAGFVGSVVFMIAMTVDRYLAIVHTRQVARWRTARAGLRASALLWLLILSVSLPVVIHSRVTEESDGPICVYDPDNSSWDVYDIFITNVLGLVLPLSVMGGCYARMIPVIMSMKSVKKHRAVKLIVSVIAVFFLFWAPYNICVFLKILQRWGKLPSSCSFDAQLNLSVTVTETIAYSHCCLNPIIYAFVGQTFMKRALHMLRQCLPSAHLSSIRGASEGPLRRGSLSPRSLEVSSTLIM